jgi:8-oxo-dGTP diphosphatase
MSRQPHHFVTVDLIVWHAQARKLLLIQRLKAPFEGHWALPGGHVELGETLEAAARRELWEETGLQLALDERLRQLATFGDPGRDPRGLYVSILYMAALRTSELPVLCAGDDAGALAWFSLSELPPMAFDHEQMLRFARPTLLTVRCPSPSQLLVRQMSDQEVTSRYCQEMLKLKTWNRFGQQSERFLGYPNTLIMKRCRMELERRSLPIPQVRLSSQQEEQKP